MYFRDPAVIKGMCVSTVKTGRYDDIDASNNNNNNIMPGMGGGGFPQPGTLVAGGATVPGAAQQKGKAVDL